MQIIHFITKCAIKCNMVEFIFFIKKIRCSNFAIQVLISIFSMETVNWKVKGMSCTNCALSINKYLKGQGLKNVQVNFMGGDVSFDADEKISREKIKKGISHLGYEVVSPHIHVHDNESGKFLSNNFQRFIFCLVFAAPLFLHML